MTKIKFHSKNLGTPCIFSVKINLCNLGLSYTFLDTLGSIECCYVFGFLGTWDVLTYRSFRHAVQTRRREGLQNTETLADIICTCPTGGQEWSCLRGAWQLPHHSVAGLWEWPHHVLSHHWQNSETVSSQQVFRLCFTSFRLWLRNIIQCNNKKLKACTGWLWWSDTRVG